MLLNAFIGHTTAPRDGELGAALGPAKPVWDELLRRLAAEHGVGTRIWKSHSPQKWGWSLRVLRGRRTVVWLSPAAGAFTVSFILGAKAVAAAQVEKWPRAVASALAHAPKYPEGTGLRLDVKSARSLPALLKLAALKLAH
jgi:hypothetical protein